MKKGILGAILSLLVVMILVPGAMADTLKITQNAYSYGIGGEFSISGGAYNAYGANYDAKAKIGESFETFCLEYNEHFSPGGTYNYAVNDRALNGGIGPEGDPISVGTAWLYSQFAAGTLQYYDYNDANLRKQDAGALQNTIWWLEGEGGIVYDSLNPFMLMVYNQFGSGATDNNVPGEYGVGVLNLTDPSTGARAQDQLVMVPEPAALLLLGAGLLGLVALRRRKK